MKHNFDIGSWFY